MTGGPSMYTSALVSAENSERRAASFPQHSAAYVSLLPQALFDFSLPSSSLLSDSPRDLSPFSLSLPCSSFELPLLDLASLSCCYLPSAPGSPPDHTLPLPLLLPPPSPSFPSQIFSSLLFSWFLCGFQTLRSPLSPKEEQID